MDKVLFLHMGGTIDSDYMPMHDAIVTKKTTAIARYFKKHIKPYLEIQHATIAMKDSRALTQKDLDNLLKKIEHTKIKKIIVTHGTYTLSESARYIDDNMKRKNAVVIITGSMTPLVGFGETDAGFNLGFAIASLDIAKPGVYVAFNARLFLAKEVSKSFMTSQGRFTSTRVSKAAKTKKRD